MNFELLRPWGGVKPVFSESGHVEYQIKGNDVYNSMQANIFPFDTHTQYREWYQKVWSYTLTHTLTSQVGVECQILDICSFKYILLTLACRH